MVFKTYISKVQFLRGKQDTYSTLDSNIVLKDGISSIKSDLIISLITVGKAKIIVQAFKLNIRRWN